MTRLSRVISTEKLDRLNAFAALFGLLGVVDAFEMKKTDSGVTLTVRMEIFSFDIKAKDIGKIVKPLGDWLCGLPKTIWDNKKFES